MREFLRQRFQATFGSGSKRWLSAIDHSFSVQFAASLLLLEWISLVVDKELSVLLRLPIILQKREKE